MWAELSSDSQDSLPCYLPFYEDSFRYEHVSTACSHDPELLRVFISIYFPREARLLCHQHDPPASILVG